MCHRLLIAVSLLASVLSAQSNDDPVVTRIIRVRGVADNIAYTIRSALHQDTLIPNNQLGVIVIHAKTSEVESLEKLISELDAGNSATGAGSDIELTVSVISGLASLDAKNGTAEPMLEPVTRQLQAIMPSKQYRTLATLFIHSGQNAFAKAEGMLKPIREDSFYSPATCEVEMDSLRIEKNNSVHLGNFKFTARVPIATGRSQAAATGFQTVPVTLRSDIDLRENQKVVVAKSDIGYEGDSLFLVVSAHIVR